MKEPKIIIKNKETGKYEKLTKEEYRNSNNKEYLTIENLSKANNVTIIIISFVVISFLISITTFSAIFLLDSSIKVTISLRIVLILGIVLTFSSIGLVIISSIIASANKNKKYIAEGNFKIVEDKIYDKNYSRSDDSTYYYVCTKIYGWHVVPTTFYDCCEKDDSVYYIMYNGTENDNKVLENEYKERYRNDKNAKQIFLAIINPISDELKNHFIPFNEKLGEENYQKRIEYKINKQKEKAKKVKCKNCGTKYNLRKKEYCPNCGDVYEFDITDVIKHNDWL